MAWPLAPAWTNGLKNHPVILMVPHVFDKRLMTCIPCFSKFMFCHFAFMKELYLVPVFTNQTKSTDFSLLRKTVKSKIAHSVSVLLQPFGTQCAHSGDSGLPQSSFPGNQAQHLSSGPMALNCVWERLCSLSIYFVRP